MQQEKVHLPDYSLQKYKEYNSKFNTASTTVEELKENLENCIRSKVSLKKELKQYSLSNLRGLLVLSEVFINNEEYFNEDLKIPNYAGSSKEVVINELYKSMLKYFCLGRNLDDSVSCNDITESRLIEIVRKAISSLTEIDLREMARKVTLYRTFLNKALNKPRTKAEFTFFISYKGKNSLDPVQKILWNNLLTNAKPTNYQINQQVKGDKSMSSTTTTIATSQPNMLASFNKEKASQVSKSNNTNITSKKEKSVNLNALEKAANTLAKKTEAILSKQRLTNTARRANMADNIEANARKELRLAKTILNLVEAIKERKSTYLMGIRYRSQVQVLEYMLRAAKGNRSRALRHCDWIDKDRELEIEDIEFVRYPYPWITKDNFKRLTLLCEKAIELNNFVADLNVLFALDLKKEDSENLYFNSQEKIDLLRSIISALKGINHSVTKSMADSLSYQAQDCETLQNLGLCDLSVLKEALKEYLQYRSNQAKEDPIKRMERDLIGIKIPNYFPTPKELIEKMLDLAKIEVGMKVLEPSAGVGHIADQIRKQIPNTDLSVIEINHRLKEILEAKGHNLVCRDFLYHKEEYSRIVMNPPFHNGEDMEHLYHAYSLLSPGGRVVSIMSEGSFFRTDKKAVEFREWFDSVGGISEKLPTGTFLNSDRPTAVATRIALIDKPVNSSTVNGSVELSVANSDFAEREVLIVEEQETVNSFTVKSFSLANEVKVEPSQDNQDVRLVTILPITQTNDIDVSKELKKVANNLLQQAKTITNQVESILAQEIELKTYEDVEKAKSVDFDVRKQLQLAKTIVKIAKAMEFSQTHLLSTIKEKDDVELLENLLQDAKYRRPKEIGKDLDNCDPELTDLDRVVYPYPRISKLMLEKVFKITSIEPLNVITSRVKKMLTLQVSYDAALIFKEPSEIKDYEEIVNLVKIVDSWLAEMLVFNQQLAYHKRLQSLGLTDSTTLIEGLKEYLALREELPKIEPVKAMQLSLLRWAVDGYFCTPKAVVTRMLDLAGIKPNMKILNACAGAGNIADGIRDRYPNTNISVIEISSELREVLVVKGHNLVASDIFKHEENYDCILMFSPFKHHYDITCFYQAYQLLVAGGKLVSIISEESFSSNFDYSIGFRKWLKALGAITEQLPEGTLVDKQTSKGISARVVVMDKYSLF